MNANFHGSVRFLPYGAAIVVMIACLHAAGQNPETTEPPIHNTTDIHCMPSLEVERPDAQRSALPNVVIFLIDTLRADRLVTYGYLRRPTSPRIDELAEAGVVFEQASSPAPWTLPTVAALMTSTFPCEHRTLDDNDRLPDSFDTLAAALQRAGYTTLCLYSNPYAGPRYGVGRNYDYIASSAHNDGRKVAAVLDRFPQPPFFLYIHNGEPHNPYDTLDFIEGFDRISQEIRAEIKKHVLAYRRLTREDFVRKEPLGTTDNTAAQDAEIAALNELFDEYNELYDTSVRHADNYVGSVIDLLQERGLWDNTLFILLADHGEELSEHGGWLHDQSAYQELLHVPLIIRYPQDRFAGRRIDDVVSLVDVMPTILGYLGVPPGASAMRGRNLVPWLEESTPSEMDLFLIPSMRWNTKKYYRPWKTTRGDLNIVVRHGVWKGIWNVEPARLELYNLDEDPWEQHELNDRNPNIALAMRVQAKLWRLKNKRVSHEEARQDQAPDDDTLEGLRKLGYAD